MHTKVEKITVNNPYAYYDTPTDEWGESIIGEISQNSKDRMAFGFYNEENNTVDIETPFFKCRDFFNDIIIWNKTKKYYQDVELYGFLVSNFNIELSKVKLILENGGDISPESFYYELRRILNRFHINIDIVSDTSKEYFIISFNNRRLLKNQIAFSFFTLLIRKAYLIVSKVYSEESFNNPNNLQYPDYESWTVEVRYIDYEVFKDICSKKVHDMCISTIPRVLHDFGIAGYMYRYARNSL